MSSAAARRVPTRAPADSLTRYLNEIATYPLLTRDEETALSQRIQSGDQEAVQQLVCANLRFVVAIAKRYAHQGVAISDLINEGNIGLIRAAQRYKHDKGVKFISYGVWWVRQAIVQALSENAHSVRVPVHRAGAMYRLGRHVDALRQELGREPTQDDLAEELSLSSRDIVAGFTVARGSVSLDAPVGNEGNLSLLEVLVDESGAAADESLIDAGMAETVRDAIASLRPRDAQIIRLYFGFDGNEPMSLEAIGQRLGITRERVRQIKDRGLSRIRRSQSAHTLASFIGQ